MSSDMAMVGCDNAAAVTIIKRAVGLEADCKYQQALVCYQEGLDMLMQEYRSEHWPWAGRAGGAGVRRDAAARAGLASCRLT